MIRAPQLFVTAFVVVALAATGCAAPSSSNAHAAVNSTHPPPSSSAEIAAIAQGADPARTDSAGIEWLCKPGLSDNPCLSSETALIVPENGRSYVQHAQPAKNPPIDCFYIYPTVSQQPGPLANLHIDSAQRLVAVAQASRFSSQCKVYAPVYPQLTLPALRAPNNPVATAKKYGHAAYDGVQSAWWDYLMNYNHGRGVVVIAHSQGSLMAEELLRTQVDSTPKERRLLVSAIIPGGNVVVPIGGTVGGSFKHIPACETPRQLHCVVAYSTFDRTPPPDPVFGEPGHGASLLAVTPPPVKGMQVLCVDPAHLSGISPNVLQPYFEASAADKVANPTVAWVSDANLYASKCMYQSGVSWLQVNSPITPGDTRTPVKPLNVAAQGLHLQDINLFLGNLVSLVAKESAAFRRTAAQ